MTRFFMMLVFSGMLVLPLAVQAETRLLGMERKENLDSLRLEFTFSEIPRYEIEESGQRIDVTFIDTAASPGLRILKEDGRLIKVLFARKSKDLIVSLLLRQVPARALIQPNTNSSQMSLDLFWEQNPGRPAIAFRIAGLPSLGPNAVTAAVRPTSIYAGQWQQFFKDYFFPLDIRGDLRFSLTSWPLLPESKFEFLPPLAQEKISAGDWEGFIKTLDQLEDDRDAVSRDYPQAVLRSEALLRMGLFDQATALLTETHSERDQGPLKARALLAMGYLNAVKGSLYQANSLLSKAQSLLSPDAPLRPYIRLLEAEIALATGKPDSAIKVLNGKNNFWPEPLKTIRNQRLVEGKALTGNTEQALKFYLGLESLPEDFAEDTFSLACAAKVFFQSGDYDKAGLFYRRLAIALDDPSKRSLAEFGVAFSSYKNNPSIAALEYLERIGQKFAEEEAGYRATMKTLDHQALSGQKDHYPMLVHGYGDIAAHAPVRGLREEAAFKQALILARADRSGQSIEALEKFCQDFHSGSLRAEAEALLTELLPKVTQDLMNEGEELSALILVEKHRHLLLNSQLPSTFLFELAQACSRLGLADRASKILLYLLDGDDSNPSKENLYPPLLEAFWEDHQFDMVESYARRYQEKFIKGHYRTEIFLYLIRALKALGELESAQELLSSTGRPRNKEIDLEEARILSMLQKDEALVASAKISSLGDDPAQETLLLQAEAMRRSGRIDTALQHYQKLLEGPFADQALYQSAKLWLSKGDEETGLKILRQLAEKGKEELWRRLAEETLRMTRSSI